VCAALMVGHTVAVVVRRPHESPAGLAANVLFSGAQAASGVIAAMSATAAVDDSAALNQLARTVSFVGMAASVFLAAHGVGRFVHALARRRLRHAHVELRRRFKVLATGRGLNVDGSPLSAANLLEDEDDHYDGEPLTAIEMSELELLEKEAAAVSVDSPADGCQGAAVKSDARSIAIDADGELRSASGRNPIPIPRRPFDMRNERSAGLLDVPLLDSSAPPLRSSPRVPLRIASPEYQQAQREAAEAALRRHRQRQLLLRATGGVMPVVDAAGEPLIRPGVAFDRDLPTSVVPSRHWLLSGDAATSDVRSP
jgi:hypothetical protein